MKGFVKKEVNDVRRLKVSYADPGIFSVFSFRFIYGNPRNALQNLESIVLTEKKAKELFGSVNVVGRSLEIKVDNIFQPFTVTGVTENVPANSSISYDLVGNFHFFETTLSGKQGMNNWHRSQFQTFVQLQPGSSLPTDAKQLLAFHKRYFPDQEAELEKSGYKWDHSKPFSTYQLQPLVAIHTNEKLGGSIVESVSLKNIWILLSIATGVLIIACINFTTLAIGRFASRAKEVGVRKIVGSARKQLIAQFLLEAVMLATVSTILGLLLVKILLPYFNSLSGRELIFSFERYPQMIWLLLAVTLLVGLLAGSYPALVLSGFKPLEVLKSKMRIGGANLFTKSLVTLQFALSISLIIATIIILQQTNYMSSRSPGFDKEHVIVVDASDVETKKIYPLFKQALLNNPAVKGIASAELGLGEGQGWSVSGFEYNKKQKEVYEFFMTTIMWMFSGCNCSGAEISMQPIRLIQ